MEVSMSKTRRGKYTESDICVFTQVQNVVCLPIQFFTYSSNCSYPMRGKSFSFYRGKIIINAKKHRKNLQLIEMFNLKREKLS